ncbi:MAG: hypothetical protein L0I29_10395 [Hyphomicrobiales bacterium]|nr:hypothetical protein [Hyphomicrobiales bacterium]
MALLGALFVAAGPAWALSEIQIDQAPAADSQMKSGTSDSQAVPPADAPQLNDDGLPDGPDEAEPDDAQTPDAVRPQVDPNAPLPEIFHDLSKLPPAVREMHDKIVEACKSGDIENLRPLIGSGNEQTQLSLTQIEGDPITFLHDLSGDTDGQEILAILEMLLEAGYVHINVGKPDEAYVWPYFYAMPLSRLDARQRVELFKIVTAGDYEEMKTYDAYVFYRLGITPQGRWAFFVAGD